MSIEKLAAKALLAFAMLLGPVLGSSAAELTLAWDPNQEPDLAGYRCYYGTTGNPPVVVDVSLETQVTLTSLIPGETYSFYVTAYNTAGLESEPSETIYYTVPLANEIRFATLRKTPEGAISFIANGEVGSIYALQARADLRTGEWVTIAASAAGETGFISLEDTDTTQPQRFYRLVRLQ